MHVWWTNFSLFSVLFYQSFLIGKFSRRCFPHSLNKNYNTLTQTEASWVESSLAHSQASKNGINHCIALSLASKRVCVCVFSSIRTERYGQQQKQPVVHSLILYAPYSNTQQTCLYFAIVFRAVHCTLLFWLVAAAACSRGGSTLL